ncbi:MAG: chorismate mutase [Bacteroidales bacterium]|nr:chorismate mutase [Bacteroidales bacterium]
MNELEEIRREIASLDRAMAPLFEKRMKLAERVYAYKLRNALPVLDAAQEEKVLERNAAFIEDASLKDYYILFQKEVMKLSRDYQTRLMHGMKVAYCGVPGAFAHIAGSGLFPEAEMVSCPDFHSAYRRCEEGEADAVILPIENSYAGDVGEVMDLGFSGSLYINMMAELDVTQNLLGIPGASASGIRRVVSHPQALNQCADYIEERGFETSDFPNTAQAAQYVAQLGDPGVGAIASVETARLYGLEVLEPHVNSSTSNTTRFAVFSRTQSDASGAPSDEAHFIIGFTVRNEAGALAKILNIIGSHGFNMSSLHSRPLKGPLWEHYFFAELEGGAHTPDGEDLLRQLGTVCDRLRLIGSYRSIHLK